MEPSTRKAGIRHQGSEGASANALIPDPCRLIPALPRLHASPPTWRGQVGSQQSNAPPGRPGTATRGEAYGVAAHRRMAVIERVPALAPFGIRSFRFQWPADLATSWAAEMEMLILGWY